jgi:hypothetical protein
MIAPGRAAVRLCGHRRRGRSPFKVAAEAQRGAEQARAAERSGAAASGGGVDVGAGCVPSQLFERA